MLYIQTASELERHRHLVYDKPVLGGDTETLGLNPHKDPTRLLQLSNGSEKLLIDVFKVGVGAIKEYIGPVLEDKNVVKIFHNGKFDTKFIKKQIGVDVERIYDTFLASVIIQSGADSPKGFHGLGSVVERYTGKVIDKSEQLSDWSGELTESQLKYAENDVADLHAVREAQIELLKKHGLVRCAKLEFEAILPIAWLELCGFYLDFEEWMKVAEQNQAKADIVAKEMYEELAYLLPQGNLFGETSINLDSHHQIRKYFTAHGIPVPKSTREHFLAPLVEQYPIVGKLLEYRGLTKAAGTFGEEFGKYIDPVTGRVHANLRQIGSCTGRAAWSEPNLGQIPKDDEHRSCFKAEEGNTLISADFSQEELRLLADFSKDKKFLEVFAKGGDFHKYTAALVYGIPVEKVDGDMRYLAKRINFGVVYGIGAKRFSETAGISEVEARMIINKYFDTFKGVKRWLTYQKAMVLKNKYNRTPSGRLVLYDFDEGDREKASAAQREGANLPLQGGGADILKRALRIFYDRSKQHHNKIKLVNIVHDQMDVESPLDIADEVQDIQVKSMVDAGSEFVSQVEIKVDAHQNRIWKKD